VTPIITTVTDCKAAQFTLVRACQAARYTTSIRPAYHFGTYHCSKCTLLSDNVCNQWLLRAYDTLCTMCNALLLHRYKGMYIQETDGAHQADKSALTEAEGKYDGTPSLAQPAPPPLTAPIDTHSPAPGCACASFETKHIPRNTRNTAPRCPDLQCRSSTRSAEGLAVLSHTAQHTAEQQVNSSVR
jgi:hypothetical protein